MRPKTFDPNDAKVKALAHFWAHGYEGTKMPDLLNSMGITRGSFYDTFGSKRDLFFASMDQYLATVDQFGQRTLADCQNRQQAIEALLRGFLSITRENGTWKGCFIGNTVHEEIAHDHHMAAQLKDGFARLSKLFELALSLPYADQPELAKTQRKAEATRLAAFLQGLLVAAKCHISERMVNEMIRLEISRVP